MKSIRVGIVAATLLLAGVPAIVSTPAPAVAAAASIKVISLNVHGGTDRNGGGNKGAVEPMASEVVALVTKQIPNVLSLQELCGSQHRALRTRLAALGYAATFTNAQTQSGCNDASGGNEFGNGLFIKGTIASRDSWALPWGENPDGTAGRQPRRLVCAKPSGVAWSACATHLATADPDRANQAAEVVRLLGSYDSRIVLGADLNMTPALTAAAFPGYYLGGTGNADHVVSTAPITAQFLVDIPSSDHDALVVWTAP